MANTTISPNMSLSIPVVGVEIGPQWAIDLNACLTVIDGHNHTPGYGVQIPSSGLNINTDLTFNINNATSIKSIRFSPLASPLSSGADIGCLYESGVDLYYNDGNGNHIRITQSGGISGTPGSITGLASPASASYVSLSSTFVWQSAANTPAYMDMASIILRNFAANSKGLTVNPPAAMASDITITLPTIPSSEKFVSMDSSGAMFTHWAVDNSTIVISSNTVKVPTGGITSTQLAAGAVNTAALGTGVVTGAKLATGLGTTTSQTFTSSGSWTAPTGVTTILVEARGGSGGGGAGERTSGGYGHGGGGGGGAISRTVALTVNPGTMYTITIGAAGTAGAGVNSPGAGGNGGNGGDTTFDVLWTWKGASGGTGGSSSGVGAGGSGRLANGGNGGTSTVNSNVVGQNSEFANGGQTTNGNQSGGGGGGAGDGAGGDGGNGSNSGTATAGSNGTSGGGGGGGGADASGFSAGGGTGTAGRMIITWVPGSTN